MQNVIARFSKLTLPAPGSGRGGGGRGETTCWIFDRCILTGRTLKLILHDFSSNLILNM